MGVHLIPPATPGVAKLLVISAVSAYNLFCAELLKGKVTTRRGEGRPGPSAAPVPPRSGMGHSGPPVPPRKSEVQPGPSGTPLPSRHGEGQSGSSEPPVPLRRGEEQTGLSGPPGPPRPLVASSPDQPTFVFFSGYPALETFLVGPLLFTPLKTKILYISSSSLLVQLVVHYTCHSYKKP
ncbi:translation initiation factor IF-2 [Salvelinus sp. IW2-2015]|uniref:translation initiation factor IF-2 n=1 Tax=Salvelinus sp. IW2-2015 TaxID=2691554 RepID=UPI000CDF95A5|nr:collagen alpha-1(XII) chain [Salvelinus alpinus]